MIQVPWCLANRAWALWRSGNPEVRWWMHVHVPIQKSWLEWWHDAAVRCCICYCCCWMASNNYIFCQPSSAELAWAVAAELGKCPAVDTGCQQRLNAAHWTGSASTPCHHRHDGQPWCGMTLLIEMILFGGYWNDPVCMWNNLMFWNNPKQWHNTTINY